MVLFDAYPNFTMAETVQDLSRELAIGLALIYPISITYTTPTKESKNELTNNTLKRKEIVSGTSDMQWTVSTLRRAAIYLCLAISSLVITIMTVFLIMSFTYGYFHLSSTLFNYIQL
ncbi:unnamed protein product [Rhizophagus irregularis]|nr:unnamed protein product [Rhizophagus irregularis]